MSWRSFEEDRKGILKARMLAVIAVFDRDLIEVGRTRRADLLKAKVRYTIAGGRVVFAAN